MGSGSLATAIITACTENYSIKTFLFDSIQHVPHKYHFHKSIEIPDEMAASGFGFQKPSWYYSIRSHREYAVSIMRKYRHEFDLFIVCDCDIQFFSKREKEWKNLFLKAAQVQIMFMREHNSDNVNCGFLVVRDADKYISFMQSMLDDPRFDTAELSDQTLVNERKHELVFDYVPMSLTVWGDNFDKNNMSSYLLHHAVNTNDKKAQLEKVRAYIEDKYQSNGNSNVTIVIGITITLFIILCVLVSFAWSRPAQNKTK